MKEEETSNREKEPIKGSPEEKPPESTQEPARPEQDVSVPSNTSVKAAPREGGTGVSSSREEMFRKEVYSDSEREVMNSLYEGHLGSLQEKDVVGGKIIHMESNYAIVNVGHKADGLVHLSEFRGGDKPKTGDTVDVFVESQEDRDGELKISVRKAKMIQSWRKVRAALENNDTLKGEVKRRTKGGLIVDMYGIEAFLPGSQVDVRPVHDFDDLVGKDIEVKVIKVTEANENVVVSHRALIEKDLEKQRNIILDTLENGQVLEGKVKNITGFGAFVDLGGVDGLLHITDISWLRVEHPEEVFKVGDKINVVILSFNKEKRRISLGMKQLQEHPWDKMNIEEGKKMKGKVTKITDYGAFVAIAPGIEGLVHISEMSWSQHIRRVEDVVSVGEEREVVVLSVEKEKHKMGLSFKRLKLDPWQDPEVLVRYKVGEQREGTVRNLTTYGLFVELEEGIDGLVHVSDLSWTRKVRHPSEMVKVGERLKVVVMEVNGETRRISLSHKHTEEDPWDSVEEVFPKDSIHPCTVVGKSGRLGFLELPHGLQGACLLKNLVKEDGSVPEEGEELDFMVQDVVKEERRILLSHVHTYKRRPAAKEDNASRGFTPSRGREEVSTMGDLEGFSALGEKISEQERLGKEKEKKKGGTTGKKETRKRGSSSGGGSTKERRK